MEDCLVSVSPRSDVPRVAVLSRISLGKSFIPRPPWAAAKRNWRDPLNFATQRKCGEGHFVHRHEIALISHFRNKKQFLLKYALFIMQAFEWEEPPPEYHERTTQWEQEENGAAAAAPVSVVVLRNSGAETGNSERYELVRELRTSFTLANG